VRCPTFLCFKPSKISRGFQLLPLFPTPGKGGAAAVGVRSRKRKTKDGPARRTFMGARSKRKYRIAAMKNLCLILVVITATSLTLHAENAASDVEAKLACDATVSSFVDSWNRADGAAYGENYWPDAELVNPSGEVVDGRAAIAQEHVELWAGIFRSSRIAAKVRRVRRLDPNHIIVDFDAELSGIRELPSGSQNQGSNNVLRSHLKHILEKRNGQWKVLPAQNTFIAGK
jgi:uncharacterized protein (TIGR02246 family)